MSNKISIINNKAKKTLFQNGHTGFGKDYKVTGSYHLSEFK